jgi:hypothetical protein
MFEHKEPNLVPADDFMTPVSTEGLANGKPTEEIEDAAAPVEPTNSSWHAEAGRKGARRVHQLIQEGKLYEKEHGLKSGRQRLRQLIEMGKLYEREHDLQPEHPHRHGERQSRPEREELIATILKSLLRLAKPSYRDDLRRLLDALPMSAEQHAD